MTPYCVANLFLSENENLRILTAANYFQSNENKKQFSLPH